MTVYFASKLYLQLEGKTQNVPFSINLKEKKKRKQLL